MGASTKVYTNTTDKHIIYYVCTLTNPHGQSVQMTVPRKVSTLTYSHQVKHSDLETFSLFLFTILLIAFTIRWVAKAK